MSGRVLPTGVSLSLIHILYTRYSISQYIILLPTVTMEKGEMVMKRILGNFRRLYSRKDLIVDYKLQPVLPWERTPAGLQE